MQERNPICPHCRTPLQPVVRRERSETETGSVLYRCEKCGLKCIVPLENDDPETMKRACTLHLAGVHVTLPHPAAPRSEG
jgi:RNase P subunit RPR2